MNTVRNTVRITIGNSDLLYLYWYAPPLLPPGRQSHNSAFPNIWAAEFRNNPISHEIPINGAYKPIYATSIAARNATSIATRNAARNADLIYLLLYMLLLSSPCRPHLQQAKFGGAS